jgi:hypothetical protein
VPKSIRFTTRAGCIPNLDSARPPFEPALDPQLIGGSLGPAGTEGLNRITEVWSE